MGIIRADIEIINSEDVTLAKNGFRKTEDIRSAHVLALVDSGAYMLCINQRLKEQLGLTYIENSSATLATGEVSNFEVVGPVTVKFQNRQTICRALVLPGEAEVLLGAIPMEDMDVVINPKLQQLTVHPDHPYIAQTILK